MLRSNSKQYSVLKKKKKAAVGRICRKGRFKPGIKDLLPIISMIVSSITTV